MPRHLSTYQCWQDMKQRCTNPRHKQYKNYGGRGIRICDRWLQAYRWFLQDMGEKPVGYTIDRIDNNGDYSRDNCRWATRMEQRRNQRTCVYIEHDGKKMTATEWAILLGKPPVTIRSRVAAGWKVEDVLDPEYQLRGRNSAPRELAALKDKS